MNILTTQHIHLVGIKGVAMTSLAQILTDAGKTITGSDVAEDFVTAQQLSRIGISLQLGFSDPLPQGTDLVVYTAAHAGKYNPQVISAVQQGIPTISQAEAVAEFFNSKKGIAVCGVGGKSTMSAMLTWIFEKMGLKPSFSVGVGGIPGLPATGAWQSASEYFIAEADEYVIDPQALKNNEEITPRFSFMKPFITLCSSISFDHPDVYRDLEHTQHTFNQFFQQIRPEGCLIYHKDKNIPSLTTTAETTLTYGQSDADVLVVPDSSSAGNSGQILIGGKTYHLKLTIPGQYNLENAAGALTVCHFLGLTIENAVQHLASFRSTIRRFEYHGVKNGVSYYDDYAHHPREVSAVIRAFNNWEAKKNRIIVFQPHTYSRTKELFADFVESFAEASSLILLDIFSSAREQPDLSISSEHLAEAVRKRFPLLSVLVLKTPQDLARYTKTLPKNTALITLGAGDIYHAHEEIHANS